MLSLSNVGYSYTKNTYAVSNINMTANNGEVTVLIGNNGAGKSTIINCIAGFLKNTGIINIDSFNNTSIEAKRIFGLVPENPSIFEYLTVSDHLKYIASAYKIEDFNRKSNKLIKQFNMEESLNKLGKELSKGNRQKLNICTALIHDPKLIIFDEPFVGLDPFAIKELKEEIIRLKAKGCCILISTHILDSIDLIWDRAYVLSHGKIVSEVYKLDLNKANLTLEEHFFQLISEVE